MYKLVDILREVKEDIKFTQPNFEEEWNEAKRYPDLFPNKETWLKAVKLGQIQDVDCSMDIDNTDMCNGDLDDLEPEKVARAMQSLNSGTVELPIIINHGGKYELIGGNTRLTALATHGLPTKAWVINMGLLSEAKQVGTLYHFTSYPKMIKIIEDGLVLKSPTPKGHISFTRNKGMVSDTISQSVRMTIDGDKLSERYKTEPYADTQAGYGRKVGRKDSVGFTGDESEERISGQKYPNGVDISKALIVVSVKKITKSFDIDNPEDSEDFVEPPSLEAYNELIILLKREAIPYKIVEKYN